MKLSNIKLNPDNPRRIDKDRLDKLVKSVKDFPKMMSLRPIVVDKDNVILGGNMRYRALIELGYEEIPDEWIKVADDLTDEERRRFIVEDNVGFGEWDWDVLAGEYDIDELTDWGMDEAILLKEVNLDKIEDIEVDENRLFVLTVEPPEAPKLKERMAFYCNSIEDYKRIKKFFEKSKSELDVEKLLKLI